MNIKCPHCGMEYEVEESDRGRQVVCEQCGNGFVVGGDEQYVPSVRQLPSSSDFSVQWHAPQREERRPNDGMNAQRLATVCAGALAGSEGQVFLTWLIFFISTSIASPIVGMIAGFLIGAVLGAVGCSKTVIMTICAVVGFVLSGIISYILFRIFVKKMLLNKVA